MTSKEKDEEREFPYRTRLTGGGELSVIIKEKDGEPFEVRVELTSADSVPADILSFLGRLLLTFLQHSLPVSELIKQLKDIKRGYNIFPLVSEYEREQWRILIPEAIALSLEKYLCIEKEESDRRRGLNIVSRRKRPDSLNGTTYYLPADIGDIRITVNTLEGMPFEVFLNLEQSGETMDSLIEAVGRLISINLQYGVSPEEIMECDNTITNLIIFNSEWPNSVSRIIVWALNQCLAPK